MGLFVDLRILRRYHSRLNFFMCEILHWSRIYVQNFQKWSPKLRFFQISGFFSDFQDFGVIKSTFLIFLNYFWKFWAQIRDQWGIWAEKCTLLFEFCRFSVKNRKIPGFLKIPKPRNSPFFNLSDGIRKEEYFFQLKFQNLENH